MEELRETQKDKHQDSDAHQHLRAACASDIPQNTIDAEVQNDNLYSICEFNL
jgi:hypothetical protein